MESITLGALVIAALMGIVIGAVIYHAGFSHGRELGNKNNREMEQMKEYAYSLASNYLSAEDKRYYFEDKEIIDPQGKKKPYPGSIFILATIDGHILKAIFYLKTKDYPKPIAEVYYDREKFRFFRI